MTFRKRPTAYGPPKKPYFEASPILFHHLGIADSYKVRRFRCGSIWLGLKMLGTAFCKRQWSRRLRRQMLRSFALRRDLNNRAGTKGSLSDLPRNLKKSR